MPQIAPASGHVPPCPISGRAWYAGALVGGLQNRLSTGHSGVWVGPQAGSSWALSGYVAAAHSEPAKYRALSVSRVSAVLVVGPLRIPLAVSLKEQTRACGADQVADEAPSSRTKHTRACRADFGKRCAKAVKFGAPPRMWGGYRLREHLRPRDRSTPRMRGGRPGHGIVADGERITPAYAGRTPGPSVTRSSTSDHPRACGADRSGDFRIALNSGSPPRKRGGQRLSERQRLRRRITPAQAGQTARPKTKTLPPTGHPRACGADDIKHWAEDAWNGSPRACGADDLVLLGRQIVQGLNVAPRCRAAARGWRQTGRRRRTPLVQAGRDIEPLAVVSPGECLFLKPAAGERAGLDPGIGPFCA